MQYYVPAGHKTSLQRLNTKNAVIELSSYHRQTQYYSTLVS